MQAQIASLQSQIKILQLQNQILTLELNIVSQPCQQSGAIYNFQTGQLCTTTPPPPPPIPTTSSITVTSPNNGAVYALNQQLPISWSVNTSLPLPINGFFYINIFDPSQGKETNIGSTPINIKSLNWPIIDSIVPPGKYKLRIYCNYTQISTQVPCWSTDFSGFSGTFSIISPSSTQPTNLPPSISGATQTSSIQQTATFTHTYSRSGTFAPTFTVTDNSGQSAKTSLSVAVVGGGAIGQLYIKDVTSLQASYSPGDSLSVKFRLIKSDGSPAEQTNHYSVDAVSYFASGEIKTPDGSNISTSVVYLGNGYWNISRPVPGASGNYYLRIVAGCFYEGTCEPGYQGWSQNARTELRLPFIVASPAPVIPAIISSNPPNGAIDARDNSAGGFVLDAFWGGRIPAVDLKFSGDLANPTADMFSISSSNTSGAPIVTQAANIGASMSPLRDIELRLNRYLTSGERITITHKPSNSSVCLGFLPGDVSQDGRFMAMDISGLNSWVGTSVGLSQPLWKTDINRDGVFDAKDVTRAGELLSSTTAPAIRFLPACPAPITVTPSSNQSQLAATLASLTSLLRTLQQSLAR